MVFEQVDAVTPFVGVWIETWEHEYQWYKRIVTPFVGVWIETLNLIGSKGQRRVTPFVGVWIETRPGCFNARSCRVTPFVGVWIETTGGESTPPPSGKSHPSWVCGLKLLSPYFGMMIYVSHPSWVCGLKPELDSIGMQTQYVTPFVGVWIETYFCSMKKEIIKSHTLRGCVD